MNLFKDISDEELFILADIFDDVITRFGYENIDKDKKKIKKYIIKNLPKDILSKEVIDKLNGDYQEMINFFKQVSLYVTEKKSLEFDLKKQAVKNIDKDHILLDFLLYTEYFIYKYVGDKLEILVSDNVLGIRVISLNKYEIIEGNLEEFNESIIDDADICKLNKNYVITIISNKKILKISTSNIECIFYKYKVTDFVIYSNPYLFLSYLSNNILARNDMSDLENRYKKELEMFSSFNLSSLSHPDLFEYYCEMYDDKDFLVNFIEVPSFILKQLQKNEYKLFWDSFMNIIKKTQDSYDSRNELDNKTIKIIDDIFASNGYQGTYPHYKKSEKTKGLRIVASYKMFYVIFNTDMDYYIDLYYFKYFNGSAIIANSGGARRGVCEDCDSLSFNNKGDSYFTNHWFNYKEEDLENTIKEIIRTTELKKINRFDKIVKDGISRNSLLGVFSKVFTIMGGFFAFYMTLVTFLIELATLFDGKELFYRIINDTPWLFIFISYWLIFGSLLGIIYAIGYYKEVRKKEIK